MKKIFFTIVLFISTTISAQKNNLLKAFEQSYVHEQSFDYNSAAADLESVYQKHANQYELNLRLGWLKYISGQQINAENYYTKAMNINPLALEAIFGKILSLIAQEKYSTVIQLANKALKISPNNSKAEYYIGLANYYQKNYLKAEKYLEKAINKYPFDLDLNLMLGWTKFALGKKNEAKSLFLIAQRNSPQNQNVKSAIKLISK